MPSPNMIVLLGVDLSNAPLSVMQAWATLKQSLAKSFPPMATYKITGGAEAVGVMVGAGVGSVQLVRSIKMSVAFTKNVFTYFCFKQWVFNAAIETIAKKIKKSIVVS